MDRRLNGDGHVAQRKNGTYQINIKYQGVQKSFYGKTEKEVRQKLRKFQVDCYYGTNINSVSVAGYIQWWLETVKKDRVKESSYDRLELTFRLYVKDEIGKIPLQKLTTDQCQKLINKRAEHLSYSTVKKVYELLNASFEYAHKSGNLSKNPMILVTMPREATFTKKTKEIVIPTEEEINKFFEIAEHTLPNGRALYVPSYVKAYKLITMTGMRIGELLALTWDKVSFEKGTALIDSSVSEIINRDEPKGKRIKRIVTDPKTKNGYRRITLNSSALEILRELKDLYESKGFNFDNHVILNSKGTAPAYHDVERTLKRICEAAGINKISLHALRHYFASKCVANGVDMIALSKHLGHAKPSITLNVYTHLMDKQQEAFKKLLETI